jgi:SpoVK/Ycf46/Vps4 family AAA+-type ATPase
MRKGADCLSKWIGESERMLRLLFDQVNRATMSVHLLSHDQAYTMRPSIIFFDEIDGLAPVRSSRQDQIYSSIVSTLLALMDGLDARSEVIVIGATVPIVVASTTGLHCFRTVLTALILHCAALADLTGSSCSRCRPRHVAAIQYWFYCVQEARQEILRIHTGKWDPKPHPDFLHDVAEQYARRARHGRLICAGPPGTVGPISRRCARRACC